MVKVPNKARGKIPTAGAPPAGYTRVFYLTTAQFAVSNVALCRVKIARFSDLNDPFELLSVDRSDLTNRAALRKKTEEINDQIGLICFSEAWENPVLWGHYAEKHTGICMGFDVPDSSLYQVIYAESLSQVRLDPKTKEPLLTSGEIDRLKRTKFKDWEYEQEMRFFVDLRPLKSESGKYFYPFSEELSLRELILGPRCEIGIKAIRRLVNQNDVVVRKARLALRTFAVVIDKRASSLPPKA